MLTTATEDLLLDGLAGSLSRVVPLSFERAAQNRLENYLHLEFGVLIGFTGDFKGNLIFKGNPQAFGSLGEVMFGMPLEGDMLRSFAGELGNMVSGGLCTAVFENGICMDISAPTIMEGDSKISGFKKGLELEVNFGEKGCLSLCCLVD